MKSSVLTLLAVLTLSPAMAGDAPRFEPANASRLPALAQPSLVSAVAVDDPAAVARSFFPGTASPRPAPRIFRLTRDQLDSTAKAVLPGYSLPSVKSVVSRDPLQTNYEYADLIGVNAANVGALSRWVEDIATLVAADPGKLLPCAKDNDKGCIETAARRFATNAFRGDVPDEKLAKIAAFVKASADAGGRSGAAADLVRIVFNSPDFVFRKETDLFKASPLAAAERAETLSYILADAPPSVLGPNGPNLFGLADHPAARAKLARFFKAWLEIREPDEFTLSPNYFPGFNGVLASKMVREADAFLDAHLARKGPVSLKALMQSSDTGSLADLHDIYGTKSTDQMTALMASVAPTQRMGLLTLPAVIASHSGPTDTRLIKRGVFFAKKILCLPMKTPPADLHVEIDTRPGGTMRQRIERTTAPGACRGCHSVINPFGFVLENYDGIGRWRDQENGEPIDASVLVDFLENRHGEPKPAIRTTTAVEALAVMTTSATFKQCFVRQLFRFYVGRDETAGDDPVLRSMYTAFDRSGRQDVTAALLALAQSNDVAPLPPVH